MMIKHIILTTDKVESLHEICDVLFPIFPGAQVSASAYRVQCIQRLHKEHDAIIRSPEDWLVIVDTRAPYTEDCDSAITSVFDVIWEMRRLNLSCPVVLISSADISISQVKSAYAYTSLVTYGDIDELKESLSGVLRSIEEGSDFLD